MATFVTMEWRRGANGTDGTYTFSPKPSLERNAPNQRQVVFKLPLVDGAVVQTQGKDVRSITLRGVLFVVPADYNTLDQKRKDLIDGFGTGPGQLHLIASGNHIFYKGIPSPEGVQFDALTNPNYVDYTITILVADPTEYVV